MNKNIIVVLVAFVFALAALAFKYYQKNEFQKQVSQLEKEKKELFYIKELERIWSAKQIRMKVSQALANIEEKKKRINFSRKKLTLFLNDLTDKEINLALSKLASLPLKFKDLKLQKSGENFKMECVCVW